MSSSVISEKGASPPPPRFCLFRALLDLFKNLGELAPSLLHPQSDEPERTAFVEDHDEDDSFCDQRDVEIVPLALVEVDREFLFADDLGEAPGRGDAARGQRREARRVDPAHLPRFSDELAVAIDHEDTLGVCVPNELLDDGQDLAIILVVHHQLRFIHRQLPR